MGGEGEKISREPPPEEEGAVLPFDLARAVAFGVGIWFIALAAKAVLPFFAGGDLLLLRSLTTVVFVAVIVRCSRRYFIGFEGNAMREGLNLGFTWVLIMFILDFFLIGMGVMQVSFMQYWEETAVFYILIPIITYGAGRMIEDHAPDGL